MRKIDKGIKVKGEKLTKTWNSDDDKFKSGTHFNGRATEVEKKN